MTAQVFDGDIKACIRNGVFVLKVLERCSVCGLPCHVRIITTATILDSGENEWVCRDCVKASRQEVRT